MNRIAFESARIVASIAALAALACATPDSAPEPAPSETAAVPVRAGDVDPWYIGTRGLDLTGDGRADSVRLVAEGQRPDSLRITLSFLVDGNEMFREESGSSYELALLDSATRSSGRVTAILRTKLDSVLTSVAVRPLAAPGAPLMMEDSAILAGVQPRPTHRISFSYGYESMTRVIWDAQHRRFVRLWSCC